MDKDHTMQTQSPSCSGFKTVARSGSVQPVRDHVHFETEGCGLQTLGVAVVARFISGSGLRCQERFRVFSPS